MNILILGGTAFFGAEIAAQLLDAGHAVTIFTRGKTPLPAGLADRASHIEGDRRRLDDLKRAAAAGPWDAVVDNIGFTAMDISMALEAFREVGRYLFTSSASVYRWSPGGIPKTTQPMDEAIVDFDRDPADYTPGDFGWDYAHGKVYAEKFLREQSDIPWTIIRPPIVLGPHDPTLRGHWYFARLMRGGPLLLANGGVNSFRLAYSRDLASAYLLALESAGAVGATYNVTQPEVVTLRDLLRLAAETLAVEADLVPIPGAFLERDGSNLGGPYAGMVNFLPSIERARTDLGYTATPLSVWLPETVRWYRDEFDGDLGTLLKTREAEIALAERWRAATAPLEA